MRLVSGLMTMCVVLWGAGSPSAVACSLTFGWEYWPPYQVGGPVQPEGLDIDLLRPVMDRAGCTLTLQELPWSRLLEEVRQGTVDGALAAAPTAERAVYGVFSVPYREESVGLIIRRGDADMLALHTLPDMIAAGHTLGIWRDYDYGRAVMALVANPATTSAFQPEDRGEPLLRMLVEGRVDGVLGDRVATMAMARDLGLGDDVASHGLNVLVTPVHFLLSKASVSSETVERINAAIREARADGTLDRILARYLGS